MRVTRQQLATNRNRILDEASRLFREHGFGAVSIADVMKAAGQTHGGFYGHFASKEALIAAVIAHSMSGKADGLTDIGAFIDAYLAPTHRDAAGDGCPTASLAGLVRQQGPDAQAAMAAGIEAQVARMAQAMPEGSEVERRRAAIGQWSAMVGALVLSRAVGDAPLADEILTASRAWLHGLAKRTA